MMETPDSVRNKPIIGYHSVFNIDEIFGSDGLGIPTLSSLRNIWAPDTYTFYQSEPFVTEQYIEFQNNTGSVINYVGFAAHNMGYKAHGGASWGFRYQIKYWDGFNWIDITPQKLPNDDSVIIEYFNDIVTDSIRVYFNFVSSGAPVVDAVLRIAHVKVGKALFLQKRTFVGVRPYTMDVSYEGIENISDNGNYLGSYVISQSQNWEIKQEYNDPTHVRDKIIPFIKHMSGDGLPMPGPPFTFFAAWRPDTYPKECLYCWKPLKAKVVPEITGRNGLMAWEASGKAIK